MKRRKIDHGPALLELASAVDVNWLSGVVCKMVSEVDRAQRRYCGVTSGDESLPAEAQGDVVEVLDDIFTH